MPALLFYKIKSMALRRARLLRGAAMAALLRCAIPAGLFLYTGIYTCRHLLPDTCCIRAVYGFRCCIQRPRPAAEWRAVCAMYTEVVYKQKAPQLRGAEGLYRLRGIIISPQPVQRQSAFLSMQPCSPHCGPCQRTPRMELPCDCQSIVED